MAYQSILNATERIEAILESNVNLDGGSGNEIRRLLYQLQHISKVVDEAERSSVAHQNVDMWLKRLQDTGYEMEDVLDEWEKEMMEPQSNDLLVSRRPIHKVCPSFLSYSNKQVPHPQIPTKILDLIKQVDEFFILILKPGSWTRILELETSACMKLYGRDEDRDFLVSKLVMEESGGVRIWCIVGMCGIGKTALARIVYDDDKVEELFELRIWIDVCGEISKGIIKWVEEERCPSSNELDVALECLRDCISGKKFLLVLDDVRTVDSTDWELVKQFLVGCGAADSKILVTARNEDVADMMGSTNTEMYRLKVLSIHESLDIIYNTAHLQGFSPTWPHEYDLKIANKLPTKCKGLPLVARLFGIFLGLSKLRLEEDSEVSVMKRFGENVLDEEIWQLGEVEKVVSHCLSLIYVELPPKLKYCFSYCAVFPKDYVIDVERVIEYWIVLGYVGTNIERGRDPARSEGQNCVDILARISLFQGLEKSEDGQIKRFKMRDMVHDFAQSIRMNGRVEAGGTGKAILQVCDPPLDSIVQEYRTLFNPPITHLSSRPLILKLRILSLRGSNFRYMPPEIKYSIHLRWLELSGIKLSQEDIKSVCKLYKLQFLRLSSCNLKEIPSEIENLSDLRNLDLSFNYFLKGLPKSICCLVELRALNLDCCHSFSKLPQGIHKLTKLEHLHYKDAHLLFKLPQGLGSLTSLQTLTKFHGGRHLNELKLLRNLNSLSGYLDLHIRLTDDLLEDAREAELKDKKGIRYLKITIYDYMDCKDPSLRTKIIDALEPHECLQKLEIRDSNGPTIPSWIISPQNQLKSLVLSCFNHVESLPPLRKLPHLEELRFDQMFGLQYVGPEFLGITREAVSEIEESEVLPSTSSSVPPAAAAYNHNVIGFAKLKKLIFNDCPNWEEWEDISTQEEKQLMPCLTMLRIKSCEGLRELPLRLLRKVPSLRVLDISGSTKLQQHYHDKASKSISQNPCFRILL